MIISFIVQSTLAIVCFIFLSWYYSCLLLGHDLYFYPIKLSKIAKALGCQLTSALSGKRLEAMEYSDHKILK